MYSVGQLLMHGCDECVRNRGGLHGLSHSDYSVLQDNAHFAPAELEQEVRGRV